MARADNIADAIEAGRDAGHRVREVTFVITREFRFHPVRVCRVNDLLGTRFDDLSESTSKASESATLSW